MKDIQYSQPLLQRLFSRILFIKEEIKTDVFFAQCTVYAVLLVWGLTFLDDTNFSEDPLGAGDSILHNVHLIFHEAGHLIFKPFGTLMHALGGSIMQVLVPFVIMVQFLRQKDNFEASVGLWICGQSFLDVAPYIYDAFGKRLPLISGGTGQDNPNTHDWHYILTSIDAMDDHARIASFVAGIGQTLLLLSFVWGAAILHKKFSILDNTKPSDDLDHISDSQL